MRVDLNYAPQPSRASNHSSPHIAVAHESSSASNALENKHQAQLSGAYVQVLAGLASQLPEIREERVHALRLAIQNGDFQVNPEKVARAMFAFMTAGSVA